MRNQRRKYMAIWLLLCGAFAIGASAQSGGGSYRIERSAIAGGGGSASGGAFMLSGTTGQHATAILLASGYRLHGGFWAPASDVIFANGFDR